MQSWATENTVNININDNKLKNVLLQMKSVQTPIIKSEQRQEITSKLQKRNDKGEKIEFVIDRGNFEERQKVERGNSEQVLPAQINKIEINGISSDKDPNKQIDNNKTEDIAMENIHNNNKASNEHKTKARIGSKTVEKEESDYKETTLTNEREKEKSTTNKTKKEQPEQKKSSENGKKVLRNSAEDETQTQSGRKNMGKENAKQSQILETIGEKKENIKQEIRKTSL